MRVEALHFTVFDKALFGSEFMGQITVTMKEIATKNNQLDEWLTLDTNHKVEACVSSFWFLLNGLSFERARL